MKKILLFLCCFATFTTGAQPFTHSIDFNTYVTSSNNDLVNNFTGPYLFIQSQTSGITGGAIETALTAGPAARYARLLQVTTDTTTVTISFRYDSLLFAASPRNDDAVSLTIRRPSVTSDSIQFDVWGDRLNIVSPGSGYGAVFPRLEHNHWFQLVTQFVASGPMAGAGTITTRSRLFDLGTSGTSAPMLVKDRFGFFSLFADGDTAILTLNAKRDFGALFLDNFYVNGKLPLPATSVSPMNLAENVIVPGVIHDNRLRLMSSLNKQVAYYLYTMDGRLLKSGRFMQQHEIDCSSLAAGTYSILLSADGRFMARRIVKY